MKEQDYDGLRELAYGAFPMRNYVGRENMWIPDVQRCYDAIRQAIKDELQTAKNEVCHMCASGVGTWEENATLYHEIDGIGYICHAESIIERLAALDVREEKLNG